jgi:molybdenum cofactor biosynthesis enzyme MoaA
MRAQNLAISIPKYEKCDKDCPYCVSKMTGYLKPNEVLFWRNMEKAKTLAKHANITSVLITGKGEPTQDIDLVLKVLRNFNEFPTELQTNGKFLNAHTEYMEALSEYGLNVLAISIDNPNEILKYKPLTKEAQDLGMLVRYTLNVTDRFDDYSFKHLFSMCKEVGIDQFSFREVTVPTDAVETLESENAQRWIDKHVNHDAVEEMKDEMIAVLENKGRFLMSLPYGARLYDYEGISVTWFDYCVQDSNEGDDIRSLIYQEDGHMYLAWNSKASRIF